MPVHVVVFPGRDDVGVVVPTISCTRPMFQEFHSTLKGSLTPPPTVVAVESAGKDFNFSRSMNAGIREALGRSPSWIVLSNDDIRLPPGWWESMQRPFQNRPALAYVAPRFQDEKGRRAEASLDLPDLDSIRRMVRVEESHPWWLPVSIALETIRRDRRHRAHPPAPPGESVVGRLIRPQPFAVFRSSLLTAIGDFDEVFKNSLDDMDFAFRSYLKGFQATVDLSTTVVHLGGASLGKEGSSVFGLRRPWQKRHIVKNWRYILQKYPPEQLAELLPRFRDQSLYLS